jgi:acyl-CoA thioester hydrolase
MKSTTKPSRDNYAHFQTIPTRWKDNDLYGHVNNVEYYSFFDTVINKWLIDTGRLDIHKGEVIGVCAESSCKFYSSIAFPDAIDAGLRIAHIGRSSVRYEIGLFSGDSEKLIAEGWFVHVFVSRDSRLATPIPQPMRDAMTSITMDIQGQ